MMRLLLLQLFAAEADGQRYRVPETAVGHVVLKAAASAGVDWGLRRLGHVPRGVALVSSVVGVALVSKGVEVLGRGHTLGPWDTVGDVAWHALGVMVLRQRRWGVVISGSVALALCRQSSPRLC